MKRIAVIGSLNIDNVTYTNNPPTPGKTVIGDDFIINIGGKGANQAMAIKYLEGDVLYFGSIGADSNGELAEKFLTQNGLAYKFKIANKPTGVSNIIINNKTAENSIICVPGANLSITIEDIDEWMKDIEKCEILIVQLEMNIDSIMYAIKRAKEAGLTTILNPAPYSDFDMKYMLYLDYFIPNDHELEDFYKGKDDILTMANKALSFGCKNVIVTLGEKGSLLVNKEGSVHIDAYKVKAVDTTCAGDSYIGSFSKALADDLDVVSAMKFASYCSSLTVQKRGAIISLPKLDEINY